MLLFSLLIKETWILTMKISLLKRRKRKINKRCKESLTIKDTVKWTLLLEKTRMEWVWLVHEKQGLLHDRYNLLKQWLHNQILIEIQISMTIMKRSWKILSEHQILMEISVHEEAIQEETCWLQVNSTIQDKNNQLKTILTTCLMTLTKLL